MTQFDFIALAEDAGLQLVDTTSESTGYPKNIKRAIIGFETMEEAQEYAEKYNLSIETFRKRDGWNLWYRTGDRAYEPFTRSAEDFGDDYMMYTANDEENYYLTEVKDAVSDFDNFDDIEQFLKERREVYDAICMLTGDEVVITERGVLSEVIPLHTMNYSYDTYHHAIGLIDRHSED